MKLQCFLCDLRKQVPGDNAISNLESPKPEILCLYHTKSIWDASSLATVVQRWSVVPDYEILCHFSVKALHKYMTVFQCSSSVISVLKPYINIWRCSSVVQVSFLAFLLQLFQLYKKPLDFLVVYWFRNHSLHSFLTVRETMWFRSTSVSWYLCQYPSMYGNI